MLKIIRFCHVVTENYIIAIDASSVDPVATIFLMIDVIIMIIDYAQFFELLFLLLMLL